MLLPKLMKSDFREYLLGMGYEDKTSEREAKKGRLRMFSVDEGNLIFLNDLAMSDMCRVVFVPSETESSEILDQWKAYYVGKVKEELSEDGWAVYIQKGDEWIQETVETGLPIYRTQEEAFQAGEIHRLQGVETKLMPVKIMPK